MQNKYAGDVGDFGKLGMLRRINSTGLTLGINWYLMPDDGNNDGKHIGYLNDSKFLGCDDELYRELKSIVDGRRRCVRSLEDARFIPNTAFYSSILSRENTRDSWHQDALKTLEGKDVVFLDPDNGLMPKSKSAIQYDGGKYVLPEELADYYSRGQSIIFYNHRTREKTEVYLDKFRSLRDGGLFIDACWLCMRFKRGTARDYFFIMQPHHRECIKSTMVNMLVSPWQKHFERIDI